jgi:transcriptional regulator with GAF, ATPase, and Fis domain
VPWRGEYAKRAADCEARGFLLAGNGGTLLLDEIGELSAVAQATLRRCVQGLLSIVDGTVRSRSS